MEWVLKHNSSVGLKQPVQNYLAQHAKGENCIFGTPIVALRSFKTLIVDFIKITLQTLDSRFS
jgi:hypothetical protein